MAFPGMNTKSGANTYRQGLVIPTRASEAEFMKGYKPQQLATTSQDLLAGKGATQGLATPLTNTEGLVGKTGGWDNIWNGSGFGNGLASSGAQYAYTDPTTGAQQYADLNAEQLDAIQNPTQGAEASSAGLGSTVGGIASGIGAAAGLANAYLGYKNYGLAKDKFAFEKAATNRSIANQASEYNTGIQNAGEVGMALAGGTMDANARAARQAQLEGQKISTAPIG